MLRTGEPASSFFADANALNGALGRSEESPFVFANAPTPDEKLKEVCNELTTLLRKIAHPNATKTDLSDAEIAKVLYYLDEFIPKVEKFAQHKTTHASPNSITGDAIREGAAATEAALLANLMSASGRAMEFDDALLHVGSKMEVTEHDQALTCYYLTGLKCLHESLQQMQQQRKQDGLRQQK